MRTRSLSVAAACTGVLAIGAQSAAADIIFVGVGRCETDATWQLTSDPAGNWSATMSYDAGATTGCKDVAARVEDDLDPTAGQRDYGQSATAPFNLVGVSVAANVAFAGTAQRPDGPASGPIAIADGLLNAEIAWLDPNGKKSVQVHRGLRSCGTGCFTTRMIWTEARTSA